jgi:alpha-2-macroglobulin
LRAATDAEIQSDERVRELVKSAQPGCWLAFRVAPDSSVNAETPLPAATAFIVTVGPGTPSAEGPRVTAEAQRFKFRTHGTLRFVKRECGYGDGCGPYDDWIIEFSNPLDADAFDPKQIRVEPELPGLKAEVYGNTLRHPPTQGPDDYQKNGGTATVCRSDSHGMEVAGGGIMNVEE